MSLISTRVRGNDPSLPTVLPGMVSALTRRRAIFGAVALGVTPAAAMPALAHAKPAPTMSAEAAALLREFHDVADRLNAAGACLDEAITATVHVPEPEALFARGQDFWVLGCPPPKRHWKGDRFTYGDDDLIARLRELPASDGNRRRTDRRDEIVQAWERWQADKAAAADASGETAASDHYQVVDAEHDAFVLRLVHMRTADPDIMKIKAALVLNAWRTTERFDNAVTRVVRDSEDIEDGLSISLMRDLMAQLGTAFRVIG